MTSQMGKVDAHQLPYDDKTRFYASIISYNDKAELKIKHACVSTQKGREKFLKQLDSLRPHGNTDFFPAIEMLENLLVRSGLFRPKSKKEEYAAWIENKEQPQRVITNVFFFSDGEPTDMRGRESRRKTQHQKHLKGENIPVMFDKIQTTLQKHIARLHKRPGGGVSADLTKPGLPSLELKAFEEAYAIAKNAEPRYGLRDETEETEARVLNHALEARMEHLFLRVWETARRERGRIDKGMFNIQFHGIGNLDGDLTEEEQETNSNYFEAMKAGLPSGCSSFKRVEAKESALREGLVAFSKSTAQATQTFSISTRGSRALTQGRYGSYMRSSHSRSKSSRTKTKTKGPRNKFGGVTFESDAVGNFMSTDLFHALKKEQELNEQVGVSLVSLCSFFVC